MSTRPDRVGERIREELMDMFLRGELKDPGARGTVVHGVRVSGDLRHATIYVRRGEPETSDRRRDALLAALERANGFLRRKLGQRLRLRHTPELRFEWDDTTERAARIEEILHELHEQDELGGEEE